ncbi:lymphotoxin-alpha-like [Corvus hawaiiensis]|uniref:lymphotoxin-alpha-like n=1 Tax=Corvus hawaiiensis TaxID=134902 RepID=UPI0020197073|nr:lymphotoxin-alpha-like [Corvus hawaiiensis]
MDRSGVLREEGSRGSPHPPNPAPLPRGAAGAPPGVFPVRGTSRGVGDAPCGGRGGHKGSGGAGPAQNRHGRAPPAAPPALPCPQRRRRRARPRPAAAAAAAAAAGSWGCHPPAHPGPPGDADPGCARGPPGAAAGDEGGQTGCSRRGLDVAVLAGSLVWEASVAPALVRNGVRLRGNRLVVPRDGLYFVYAAAAFQGSRCPAGARRRPLRLAVVPAVPRVPADVPLLRAARSVCRGGSPGGLWVESLYQGAVFQLRRGDQLAATTSAGRFLDLHGAGQAYFGVLGVD